MAEKKTTTEQKSATPGEVLTGQANEEGGAMKHGTPVMETTEETDDDDKED